MDIYALYNVILRYFRPRRMRKFWHGFNLTPRMRVLDVGGTWYNWSLLPEHPRLTILNLSLSPDRSRQADWLIADARHLPFKDGAFDVVYSNSVIEHLSNAGNQHLFAAECSRVGQRYYIQTPNRRFPIEPHLITPFIHWLPRRFQRRLLRNMTLWGLLTRPSEQRCDDFMQEIHLLDEYDLKGLFPEAAIWRERFLGLIKSLIAVKI